MKLYLSVIGIFMALISVFNILLETAPWYYVIISVVFCTALQFALDGAVAIVVNKILPTAWFGADKPIFAVSEIEKKLYKKLKVRRWKDKVWELGGLGGFSKKHLKEPDNPEYIERFIVECNKGVATHRISYFIGFLAMLTVPGICSFTVALPVALVNLFLNVLPTLALRYNTPMLKSVLTRQRKKREEAVLQ